ncbi:MAG: LysR substrate-binding domain-containing protein [Pseudomonadota bacterium]|nr:LysR substrate-binding domain-containing protein [Pseudomonadota bacterium]
MNRDLALLLRLRTRQLALLSLLDTERHLGRAAAALSVSQPAASKLLLQIEQTFGMPLFERHARGMTPTAHGEVLIRYARRTLADFGSAREALSALSSGLQGALRIGSVPGAVPELLAPLLCEYKRLHPGVAVSVLVSTSDVMIGQLARGEVDLVLGRPIEASTAGSDQSQPLLAEALVVVAREHHPIFQRSDIAFGDLLGEHWILQPPGSPQRLRFDAFLREAGVSQRMNITETASNIVTTALLEISDMVSFMPGSLAAHYGRLGVLRALPLDLAIQVPPIHLITPAAALLSPQARRFVDLVNSRPAPRLVERAAPTASKQPRTRTRPTHVAAAGPAPKKRRR